MRNKILITEEKYLDVLNDFIHDKQFKLFDTETNKNNVRIKVYEPSDIGSEKETIKKNWFSKDVKIRCYVSYLEIGNVKKYELKNRHDVVEGFLNYFDYKKKGELILYASPDLKFAFSVSDLWIQFQETNEYITAKRNEDFLGSCTTISLAGLDQ